MTGFRGTVLTLSQSFRFGPVLALEASRWLSAAGIPIRLTGTEQIPTTLGLCQAPDAVLCRTNVRAMNSVIHLLQAGLRTAQVGGGGASRAPAPAAGDLKEGRSTTHPELVFFPTWGAVQDYAAYDPAGGDLQLPSTSSTSTEPRRSWAQSTACTTRRPAGSPSPPLTRPKGGEWPRVQIAADFRPPRGRRPSRP